MYVYVVSIGIYLLIRVWFVCAFYHSDQSGTAWFSLFNDMAAKLLGKSADELYEMKSMGQVCVPYQYHRTNTSIPFWLYYCIQDQEYEAVFAAALFQQFVFKSRVKADTVNDEQRVKNTILRMDAIDYETECKELLNAISLY